VDEGGNVLDAVPAEQFVLQVVLVVEQDERHRRPVWHRPAPPAVRDLGSRRGQVAERAERVDAAALHGGRLAGDRREDVAPAEQLMRVRLVLDAQLDRGSVPSRDFGEDVTEPDGERVGVDRHRQLDRGRRRDRLARLGVQQPGLPAEPDEPFAVRGGAARGPPADQHLARRGFKRADALADRARRDVQLAGGRLEGTVIGDRHEGIELGWVEVHQHSEAQIMDTKKHSFALIRRPA
jgi:hypothetical protein